MVVGSPGSRIGWQRTESRDQRREDSDPAAFLFCPSLPKDAPAMVAGNTEAQASEEEVQDPWQQGQSSGSTTRRASASSPKRVAKTYSSTSAPSRPRASRASPRAIRSSSR